MLAGPGERGLLSNYLRCFTRLIDGDRPGNGLVQLSRISYRIKLWCDLNVDWQIVCDQSYLLRNVLTRNNVVVLWYLKRDINRLSSLARYCRGLNDLARIINIVNKLRLIISIVSNINTDVLLTILNRDRINLRLISGVTVNGWRIKLSPSLIIL